MKYVYLLGLPDQQKILINFKWKDKFEWEPKASKEELKKLFSPLASYAGDDDETWADGTFGKSVLNSVNLILKQVQLYLHQEEEDKKSKEIEDLDDWDDDWEDDEDDLFDSTDREDDSKEISLLEASFSSLKPKREGNSKSPNISDVIQNLKDLSLLHKDGILNDEEFEQMKNHLLNGIK